ncbi:unnamed protein product [Symbiodinium natans]|uniref:Transmembrane protein n=1 Tax=Symbiodinium natans TaxID=878477 RepID=A0A812R0I1_9DINO|nr:unnamed protein product [Symbiodinium natans]
MASEQKDVAQEVNDDEVNINSTVGLVSALIMSCMASGLTDSWEFNQDTRLCEELSGTWCFPKFEVYQVCQCLSMICNMVAIMTSIARLLAFQRMDSWHSAELRDEITKGFLGKVCDATPSAAMALGVVFYAAGYLIQASIVMPAGNVGMCIGFLALGVLFWVNNEVIIQRAKKRVRNRTTSESILDLPQPTET